jgi:Zn-dependent protease
VVGTTLRLGRVAGIELRLHWSLAIAFVLIVWTLAGQALPDVVPDQPLLAYWLVAVAAVVLFYVSLLSHEMGHALMARRLAVTVDGITLWVFGGVARLRSDAVDPGTEARIAIAGPVVSLALAIAFGAATFALDTWNGPPLLEGGCAWLAASNAVLLFFNLLPAFPLDGGRLLRAWLWHRTGDRYRATARAAWLARILAVAIIALGLVMLIWQGGFSGLWLMFLGLFLLAAIRGEQSQVAPLPNADLGSALPHPTLPLKGEGTLSNATVPALPLKGEGTLSNAPAPYPPPERGGDPADGLPDGELARDEEGVPRRLD